MYFEWRISESCSRVARRFHPPGIMEPYSCVVRTQKTGPGYTIQFLYVFPEGGTSGLHAPGYMLHLTRRLEPPGYTT